MALLPQAPTVLDVADSVSRRSVQAAQAKDIQADTRRKNMELNEFLGTQESRVKRKTAEDQEATVMAQANKEAVEAVKGEGLHTKGAVQKSKTGIAKAEIEEEAAEREGKHNILSSVRDEHSWRRANYMLTQRGVPKEEIDNLIGTSYDQAWIEAGMENLEMDYEASQKRNIDEFANEQELGRLQTRIAADFKIAMMRDMATMRSASLKVAQGEKLSFEEVYQGFDASALQNLTKGIALSDGYLTGEKGDVASEQALIGEVVGRAQQRMNEEHKMYLSSLERRNLAIAQGNPNPPPVYSPRGATELVADEFRGYKNAQKAQDAFIAGDDSSSSLVAGADAIDTVINRMKVSSDWVGFIDEQFGGSEILFRSFLDRAHRDIPGGLLSSDFETYMKMAESRSR